MIDGGTLVDHNGRPAVRFHAARDAAGWTVCLAELGKHLAGQVAGGPHSETAESWREHYEAYVAAGMPSGSYIPAGA